VKEFAARQTRIFVPLDEPEADWAETVVGRVLAPLCAEFGNRLDWFWFSRYGASEHDDCDLARIPPRFRREAQADAEAKHRSVRFRYAVAANHKSAFEQRARRLIERHGYAISDFRPYDVVADTGKDRFLGNENRLPGRAERRARLVVGFYMATCRLFIDALVGPDEQGRFRLESNDDAADNPRGSTFQSLLHLFCNITSVPTDVYVHQKKELNVLGFGTFIYPPPAPPGGWDESSAHPIYF
jgi:hypothetical protein